MTHTLTERVRFCPNCQTEFATRTMTWCPDCGSRRTAPMPPSAEGVVSVLKAEGFLEVIAV